MNFINLREIRTRLPRSRSTLYDEIARGVFPKPIKIGRGSYWDDAEIDRLLSAYSSGATQDELRTLCTEILQDRLAS